MGKKIKKGTTGDAAKYTTRSSALKRLKLSLKEFRRLCILKGVFPKEPKRKFKGQNKTYYLLKDIRYLSHEKLINKFREINAFQKKINRAKSKVNKYNVKKLKENKPSYSIQHIIKERYPRITDALNDLDDAISLISLFATLPKHELLNIKTEDIEICKRLIREFLFYIAVSQGLKRAFISVKGFYLNTEIMGIDITWLQPFANPQKLPFEVDYEVMTSFLELYQNLMKFVNFKLYKDIGLEYPPSLSEVDFPFFGLNSLSIASVQSQVNSIKFKESENIIETEEYKEIKKKGEQADKLKSLFKGFVFYISREVSKEIFELAIVSCGGLFGDDSEGSSFSEKDSQITHYIVDKPHESINFLPNKEYIQPQWVFDCINQVKILPTSDYAPQKTIMVKDNLGKLKSDVTRLPPHISPFYEYTSDNSTYKAKNINRPVYEENDNEIEESTEVEVQDTQTTEDKSLKEMLLSKNKRKLLQKIRDENLRKSKKIAK